MDQQMVRLRPVEAEDLSLFERQGVEPDAAGRFNWSGFKDAVGIRRRYEQDGWLGADDGRLVVTYEDKPVGQVGWGRVTYGVAAWWCWNIGISLLPEFRGQGIGCAAQRLLVEYLFDVTTVERIEAFTDVENTAEQRALEKVGFQREGVTRAAQFRAGSWRDVVMYSVLRSDRGR